jgi:acyl-CoA synthetase (AMP-forming)/AMP-acid ligase II
VLFPLLGGATSTLLERWSPSEALELIEREGATIVSAVPTQLVKLLQEPAAAALRAPQLRVVTNAGAPMPPDAAAALETIWDCRIQTVYGATDGGVPLMTSIDDPVDKRRSTVGSVIPMTELLLVDEELRPVAPGERGEILWHGPTKSFGYLNEPGRTEETFWGDGYYRSGDLGELDADGYVRIVGRAKDLIIRGGQNISPREIEEAVAQHPAVSEVAAVGLPDPVYGERVCAVVSLLAGEALELAELLAFLKSRQLAPFKLPERLEILPELPKNASGKTSKQDVRRLVLER